MLDDFALRALLGGVAVALAAGPLGSFIVWRRMAYFGDALAHSALLGIALGFVLAIEPVLGVLATCSAMAFAFVFLQEQRRFAADTLLGLLAHSALALGLVVLSLMENFRVDLLGYLFGDILSISKTDVAMIYAGVAGILAVLAVIWRRLLAVTVNAELAQAEGIDPLVVRLVFTLLLAVVIAISMRIVGILLITSLLLIPAATARPFATTPERMALYASLAGMMSVVAGLAGSFGFDTPAGPSIVVAALVLFLAAQIASRSLGVFSGVAGSGSTGRS